MLSVTSKCDNNISFKAYVNYDRVKIAERLFFDKKLTPENHSTIMKLLDRIDGLKKMEENSVIELFPRVDKGQMSLVCNVFNKSKKFFHPLSERSVRKLVSDSAYFDRYIKNTESLVRNVFKTDLELTKLTSAIMKAKNIKGIVSTSKEDLAFDGVHQYLAEHSFKSKYIESLTKGYCPTKTILKLIKDIDKKSAGADVYIGIKGERASNRYTNTYFVVKTINGDKISERRVLLSELFKEPLVKKLL